MNKKEKQKRTIAIYFKLNSGTDNITISDLRPKLAKKAYRNLVYQWRHYKAVSIPLYAFAVAADNISYITITT